MNFPRMFVKVPAVFIAFWVLNQLISVSYLKPRSQHLTVQGSLPLLRFKCLPKSLLVGLLDPILHFLVQFGFKGFWNLLSTDGTALVVVQSLI